MLNPTPVRKFSPIENGSSKRGPILLLHPQSEKNEIPYIKSEIPYKSTTG